ncbi:hypothetical protein SESBI_01552 [Sesbania bispinosa]|nr:hypothetical protein SESBI_01552 [Sesbania bispinosa]
MTTKDGRLGDSEEEQERPTDSSDRVRNTKSPDRFRPTVTFDWPLEYSPNQLPVQAKESTIKAVVGKRKNKVAIGSLIKGHITYNATVCVLTFNQRRGIGAAMSLLISSPSFVTHPIRVFFETSHSPSHSPSRNRSHSCDTVHAMDMSDAVIVKSSRLKSVPLFELVTLNRVEADCIEIYEKERKKMNEMLDKLPGKSVLMLMCGLLWVMLSICV